MDSLYRILQKLEALEMWIFKRLARVNYKDRVTNEEVLSRLGVERGQLSQIRTHKFSYFGHIARYISEHKASPGSCDLEFKPGKSTPEWI